MKKLRGSVISADSRLNAKQVLKKPSGVPRPTLRLPQIRLLHSTDKALSRSTVILVARFARDWLAIQAQVCSSILLPTKVVIYVITISSTRFAVGVNTYLA